MPEARAPETIAAAATHLTVFQSCFVHTASL